MSTTMEGNSPYVTNLVNSIIGVSVLAMPFCFKQCGIILGLGLLCGSAWLTYISCSMLATSAFHKRRRTYEYLALYTLGPTGKFAVELSMIGMMLGTCVAFYVVIGDLSNGIITKFIDGADPQLLRIYTIIFCALCIVLPLSLMKSLSVLSYFGFFSLIFYMAFVVVVILNAVSNGLLSWQWYQKVHLWRPAGMFQCLPIFSLAYACQCQLFIVYDSLEEPSVRRIENIVSHAIKFVTAVYMSVGFFGYTTYGELITGNLLVSFPSNLLLDFIKLGFAMSVLLGFPLIIFPCRQSIHTLFFSKPQGEGLPTNTTYIPPFLFKSITLVIVLSTMIVAIVIPNVETILGLTGATMGSIICFIFPALIYDKASPKGSGSIPKFVFAVGCLLLVVCTYSNLANTGQQAVKPDEFPIVPDSVPKVPDVNIHELDKNPAADKVVEELKKEPEESVVKKEEPKEVVAEVIDDEHRHEPANPIDPDNPAIQEKSPEEPVESEKQDEENKEEQVEKAQEVAPVVEEKVKSPKIDKPVEAVDNQEVHVNQAKEPVIEKAVESQKDVVQPVKEDQPKNPDDKPIDHHPDPQEVGKKKDELGLVKRDEVKVQDKDALQQDPDGPQQKELLEKIKEQHEKQQQLLIEQEELIKKLEEHQDKKEQEGEIKPSEKPKKVEEAKHPGEAAAQPHPVGLEARETEKRAVEMEKEDGKDEKAETNEAKLAEKPDKNGAGPGRELLEQKSDSVAVAPKNMAAESDNVAPAKEKEEVAMPQNAEADATNQKESPEAVEVPVGVDRVDNEAAQDGVQENGGENNKGEGGDGGGNQEEEEIHPRAERSADDDSVNMQKVAEGGEMQEEKESTGKETEEEGKAEDVIKLETEERIEDCLEEDIDCWEGKPKSRELKSVDDKRDET